MTLDEMSRVEKLIEPSSKCRCGCFRMASRRSEYLSILTSPRNHCRIPVHVSSHRRRASKRDSANVEPISRLSPSLLSTPRKSQMTGPSQSIAHDSTPELVSTAVPASTSTPPPLPEESVNSTSNPLADSDIKQKTRRLSSFTPGRDSWVTEQLQFYNASVPIRSPIVFDLTSEADAYSLLDLKEDATLVEVEQKISEALRVYRERSDVVRSFRYFLF